MHTTQRHTLRDSHTPLFTCFILSVQERRNAELVAENARCREEVRKTHERADAMEAASALLNESDDVPLSTRESAASQQRRWSENIETRKGARMSHGSVALTSVPMMNGGGAPSPSAADAKKEMDFAPSPASTEFGEKKMSRKASFGRKAGRKLVRSLSFSYDDRKK